MDSWGYAWGIDVHPGPSFKYVGTSWVGKDTLRIVSCILTQLHPGTRCGWPGWAESMDMLREEPTVYGQAVDSWRLWAAQTRVATLGQALNVGPKQELGFGGYVGNAQKPSQSI